MQLIIALILFLADLIDEVIELFIPRRRGRGRYAGSAPLPMVAGPSRLAPADPTRRGNPSASLGARVYLTTSGAGDEEGEAPVAPPDRDGAINNRPAPHPLPRARVKIQRRGQCGRSK